MNDFDETLQSIEASLAHFTRRLDDDTSELLREMRKCSFLTPFLMNG